MPYSSDNVADIRNLQQYCSKIFGATEALPLLYTLVDWLVGWSRV